MELARNNTLSPTKPSGNVRHVVLFIGSLMTALVNNPKSHKGHRGCLGCPGSKPTVKTSPGISGYSQRTPNSGLLSLLVDLQPAFVSLFDLNHQAASLEGGVDRSNYPLLHYLILICLVYTVNGVESQLKWVLCQCNSIYFKRRALN